MRVSASRPRDGKASEEIDLHFVNYNRHEPPRGRNGRPTAGGGIVDEKPIAVSDVNVDLVLPQNSKVAGVDALIPEKAGSLPLKFTQAGGRVRFDVPEFLVYCVVRIHLATP